MAKPGKRGRPQKLAEDRRDTRVVMLLTLRECRHVEDVADSCGQSLSAFCREAALSAAEYPATEGEA